MRDSSGNHCHITEKRMSLIMKSLYRIAILAIAGIILTSCLSGILDFSFRESQELIVPANGETYYFEVEATQETKTSFSDRLWSFEYRVLIDGIIYNQQIVNIILTNEHIYTGDVFTVPFDVPANETEIQRRITVEALKALDDKYYHYHVDAPEENWQLVWAATQEGR